MPVLLNSFIASRLTEGWCFIRSLKLAEVDRLEGG